MKYFSLHLDELISKRVEICKRNCYFENRMQDEPLKKEEPEKRKCPARKWTKRAGIIAFLFFLGKGLVWLGVAAAGAYYTFN